MLSTNPVAPPSVGLDAIPASMMKSIADRERASDRYWTHKDKLVESRVWWRPAPRGTCSTCCPARRSWSWGADRAC